MVAALSGILHHLYLRQIGTVGKSHVTYDEVKRSLCIVGVCIGVLEVEGLQIGTSLESIGSNAGHKSVIVEVT